MAASHAGSEPPCAGWARFGAGERGTHLERTCARPSSLPRYHRPHGSSLPRYISLEHTSLSLLSPDLTPREGPVSVSREKASAFLKYGAALS